MKYSRIISAQYYALCQKRFKMSVSSPKCFIGLCCPLVLTCVDVSVRPLGGSVVVWVNSRAGLLSCQLMHKIIHGAACHSWATASSLLHFKASSCLFQRILMEALDFCFFNTSFPCHVTYWYCLCYTVLLQQKKIVTPLLFVLQCTLYFI